MDKVHQAVPGSSNTSEPPTWLPNRVPFGAWLIEPYYCVSRAVPRSFQTVPGFREYLVRRSKPYHQFAAFSATFATSLETRASQGTLVFSVSTNGQPTSVDITISGATGTKLSFRLAPCVVMDRPGMMHDCITATLPKISRT
ncbi:hypothetical protein T4B_134 [Trichinella pseudospiralis]|uniref:Uncharacterized protein n=1 Tax=Trichinella pseudospiralis TaxID=6337 RepID=A0A0V1ESZ6_TRIPS|nr:hypothetical protein T4A_7957 [Trichinella pseudospiralis]KRZ07456.1 hypothetical protein T4B_134 [Trichinella pseudospiralis]